MLHSEINIGFFWKDFRQPFGVVFPLIISLIMSKYFPLYDVTESNQMTSALMHPSAGLASGGV